MRVTETSWENMDWIHLTQYVSVAGCCQYDSELSDFVKCREFLDDLNSSWPFKWAVLPGIRELQRTLSIRYGNKILRNNQIQGVHEMII
jgi:hypothetical protein